MFKKTFSAVLSTAILCLAQAQAAAPLEGTKPAHWRVIWTSNPANSAIVSWSTAAAGSKHTLLYRLKGSEAKYTSISARNGRHTGKEVEFYYHHAQMKNLKPSTAYEILMKSDNDKSRIFYFVTGPANDRPFSILHGGDSRSDHKARRSVNRLMATLVRKSYENDDASDDILAFAHGGDYIVTGTNLKQWSQWLSDHELTTTTDGRITPIIPARGNHDKGKPFNEVFGFPTNDLNYYAIDLGPKVRFVTLNTETSTAGKQAKWLDTELKTSRPKSRWLLVQYHRPAYPAVKTPGTALQSWVPLFDKHNVDLVCEADGHNIKRTFPIRANVKDETGVVYIGEGGLGVQPRTPKSKRWYLQPPGMSDKGNHVFLLTFTEKGLHGKCVMVDESIKDRFTRPVRKLKKEEKK